MSAFEVGLSSEGTSNSPGEAGMRGQYTAALPQPHLPPTPCQGTLKEGGGGTFLDRMLMVLLFLFF